MKDEIKSNIKNYYDFWFGINNLYEIWAKKQGVTCYSIFTLYVIRESKGNCTQKMICEQLLYPKQTVNTILNTFEEKGLVSRVVMEKDKRNKIIVLTEKGKEYADSILDRLYDLEESALLKMDPKARNLMSEKNKLFLDSFKEALAEEGNGSND